MQTHGQVSTIDYT